MPPGGPGGMTPECEQFREDHFKDEDKYNRYLMLKSNYEAIKNSN